VNRKSGHIHAALRRRVRTDAARRSTRRALLLAAAAWPALAWASAAFAQTKKAPIVIGWLNGGSRVASGHLFAAFKEGLAALGRKEGPNVIFEERWADGRSDRLPALAGELAAKGPAVIVAGPLPAATAAAAKAAPNTPIVHIGGDPVAAGLVASLARPGGMVTGVTNFSIAISEKYLELLLAAAPRLRRIGFLIDTTATNHAVHMANARRSVAQHSVEARYAEVGRPEEIEPALSRLAKEGVQALVVMPGQATGVEWRRIVKLALARRWPVIAIRREWAEEGALLSYGVDQSALYRRAAYYVDRILKGAKPGDLPIEQPTKFELVVNLKTAKAIGLTISQDLLFRADKVIE
jgi:putative ABC transport system substrate-binding protein